MRKAVLLLLLLWGLSALPALALTAVSGTLVQDGNGNPLASGQWCFNSTCLTVTNGSFSGNVTAGTTTVTVVNASSVTILSVSNVTIGTSPFVWDNFVVPYGTTFSGYGTPYLACQLGSQYTQNNSVPSGTVWNCVVQNGQLVWQSSVPQSPIGPGIVSGIGVPTGPAVVPTLYVRTDVVGQYSVSGPTGTVSSTWTAVGGSGSFVTLSQDAVSQSNGSTTEVVGLLNHLLPSLTTGYLNWTGSAWVLSAVSGSSPTIQTNGTNNASQSTLNFITSTTNTVGLTATPSNPATTGNEKIEITGTYSGSISSSQVTAGLGYTPANCTPGTSGSDCLQLSSGLVPTGNLPTVPIVNGGTGQISASAAFNALSPLTTLGDILYENSTPAGARLAGYTTANTAVLTQTGTGSVSAAPSWSNAPAISAANMTSFPTLNQNTTGYAAGLAGGALGSVPYQSAANTTLFTAPNTTTSTLCYTETGTGSVGAAPVWSSCAGSPATAWSSLTNPTTTLSLTLAAADTTAFTWSTAASPSTVDWTWTAAADTGSSTTSAFIFDDTTGNTRTGPLVDIHSVGTSTILPVRVTAQGTANGVDMTSAGLLQAIGSGGINATELLGATWTAPGTIGSGTPSSGAFTTLSASSTVSGTGFSNYLASPPAIGSTSANTGAFTTLTASTSASAPSFIGTGTSQSVDVFGVANSAISTTNFPTNYAGWAGPTTGTPTFLFQLPNAAPSGNQFIAWTTPTTVNGVSQAAPTYYAAPSGVVVGTTDTQTLTNKSIAGSEINSGLVASTVGGTGVNNSATLTLGTSNQNWATLGTGIVKNTTTTGALSDAASSDVISLWTGTCNSSTYLNGAGACASPSGSGTVTASAQYDVAYYPTTGTVATVQGAAISGFQFDSTSAAPTAATATNLGTLANIAQYDLVVSDGTSAALAGIAPSSTSGLPLLSQGSSSNPAYAALALTALATQGADTMVANMTAGTATPTAVAIPTTAHGVWLGEGPATAPGITAAGTSGYPLVSGGASADPSFAQLTTGGIASSSINGTDTKLQSGTGSFSASYIAIGDANGGVTPATAIPNGVTATTQSAQSNDTKVATDAYVDSSGVHTVADTSTPVTVSTTLASEYHFNENATAATAITYDLPTAAAGKQFCFSNAYNGSAANTGTLELLTSASGQFIIFTDGTLSATGGYVISGGAARDSACVVGVDSTHWALYVQEGTWAKH